MQDFLINMCIVAAVAVSVCIIIATTEEDEDQA
jgi:hypothetical protein